MRALGRMVSGLPAKKNRMVLDRFHISTLPFHPFLIVPEFQSHNDVYTKVKLFLLNLHFFFDGHREGGGGTKEPPPEFCISISKRPKWLESFYTQGGENGVGRELVSIRP
jgi:hypothetical protein